jgi:hypothetical protein
MALLKKIVIYSVCIAFLSLQVSGQVIAGNNAQNNSGAKITEKAPQVLSTPPQEIPVTEDKKKPGSKTMLIAVGAVAVVAVIAAALGGGGGGGGGGSNGPVPPDDDAGIGITW